MMTDGRQRFFDRLYVLLLGAAIAALAWIWRFDSVPPALMDDLAAAAGLRPPAGPLSLAWHCGVAWLCREFGLQTTCVVLRAAGSVSLGLMALLAAALLKMSLPATLRRGEHVAAWWRVAVRVVLFQGVVFFCCSEPVWSAFCWFSPLSLQTLALAAAATCFVAHFRSDSREPLFASFVLLGAVAADTPVAFVFLAAAVSALYRRRMLRRIGALPEPPGNPLANAFMSLRLTIAFAIGAAAVLFVEVRAFDMFDGLAVFGWTWGDYACKFPIAYVKAMVGSCTPLGAAVIALLVVLPVVVQSKLIRRATDDETHLSYLHGAIFLVLGLAAFSQLSGAKPLWFWTWGGGCVSDGVLKCASMFLCALAAVWSLSVFTIELYLRNFRRIELLRSQDAAEAPGAAEAFARVKRLQSIVRTCLLAEPLLALLCVVPFRSCGLERAMLGVVADAARETAEECRGVDYLFTDGGLDAAVELAAALEGRRLCALSMMGGYGDRREMYLRTRGAADAADREVLESGAADALRTWVRTRPDKAESYAVQIGFELWRRDGRPMPECSGLVARPKGMSAEEVARGAAAGRALAKRLLALYGDGGPDGSPDAVPDHVLRDAFLFAQWRLAVIARHRANAYDGRGETELAMEETRIADALDKKNAALARIRDTMAWTNRRRLERMTAQEGLRAGLVRADFARARIFAQQVLAVDPDNPEANFALGMDFFVQRQYARAQAYLERCLERRPNDPAVLNNLAQCRLRQGDPKGALPYAERAQEILPDAPEIKYTVERIRAEMHKDSK